MKKQPTILFLFLFITATVQSQVTLNSLLKEMTATDAVVRFPNPAYVQEQASSYDRRSVSPDMPGWFANGDFNHFNREEQRGDHSEFVMMDADGPGAIVRFWLTTLAKPGVLRFYFDNETEASVQIQGFDLMKAGFGLGPALLNPHTSYEPQGKGGNTLYLPLPYQKHCKVTWQFADSANKKTPHYYQVNYRTYPPGTSVETFRVQQLTQYKNTIDETEALLWQPKQVKGKALSKKLTLAPGEAMSLPLAKGAAAIRSLQATMAPVREEMWRGLILKIQFDGHQTVICPLGDFIGSGYGGKPVNSWYRTLSAEGALTSRWVMPYRKSAVITIENRNDFDITLSVTATTTPFKWDERTMYFYATYKYERDIKDVNWDYDPNKVAKNDPAGPIDWNFVRIKGRGVYLGNTLAVNNHMNTWYGEGDAKIYVDDEAFPSEFGTGLEDYYNTSWAPVILYQTPFANAPRADSTSSIGHNTFTRTRILDRVPFLKSFSFDMEMLSWGNGTIDAAATTYWYGFEGAAGGLAPVD